MTIITSRRAVILFLTALLLIFLYLGYTDAQRKQRSNLSMEQLSNDLAAISDETGSGQAGNPPQLAESNGVGDDFFIEYRLERDRQRAKEIELLQSLINDPNSATEIKQEAQAKLLQITTSLDQELTLETLILAKGYSDAVAVVQQGQVTIIVRHQDFTEEDSIRIAELVSRNTGYPLTKITILNRS
ncbi:MAG TPA: SpoIIIAH-like family protein [Clostridia bacterium]|nr:SpoIIIAH-like family protein [Clostridia bacterium]